MTILGLSGMKVRWIDDVPTNVREALFSSISENIKHTIENKYSMNRGKNVRKMMVDSKYLMTFQSVSNILYGLSSMGVRWGTMGADSRNLGGGSGPNSARSDRDDKSEDMGGSGGRPSPGSGGQMRSMMDDGNAKQTSGNTTFPESKVVYSGTNTPPPKPVRSVLGQYEANMASAGKTDKMDGRGNDDDDDKAGSEHKSDYLDSSKSSSKSRKNDRSNTSANKNQRSNNDSGRELDTGRDRHFSMYNQNKSSTRSRSKGRRYNNNSNNNNDDDNENDNENENDDYKDDGTNYPNSHNARNDEGNVTPENIPQNVPGNRMSWGKSLFGRRKSKGPEDPSVKRGSLTVPHPAHSPVEKATRFMPTWMRSGDSGSSSPVAL